LNRFERQLSRYKARLVDRNRRQARPQPATNGLLTDERPAEPEQWEVPNIVRTKRFELVPMLPEDAAFQLELLGHDFFLFTNASSGEPSLLYRRKDGQLGLIESIT
jgi:putative sigma-54 modulation protein